MNSYSFRNSCMWFLSQWVIGYDIGPMCEKVETTKLILFFRMKNSILKNTYLHAQFGVIIRLGQD